MKKEEKEIILLLSDKKLGKLISSKPITCKKSEIKEIIFKENIVECNKHLINISPEIKNIKHTSVKPEKDLLIEEDKNKQP